LLLFDQENEVVLLGLLGFFLSLRNAGLKAPYMHTRFFSLDMFSMSIFEVVVDVAAYSARGKLI
jgi:hypothetical protein